MMQELIERMESLLGADAVMTSPQKRQMYSQDVYSSELVADMVVSPGNSEELAGIVRAAAEARVAVVPRGGGMSYTSGYVPAVEHSVMVDMSQMNSILEVNLVDMYVTVEAGVTWQSLHEELKGSGMTTPYWGTLSGMFATVGGGMSQNSVFWGSAQHGTAADSVLGMEVVLADGTLLNTGSSAQLNALPFFRHFGPDLTGLFTSDCGALGIKATVTLKLVAEKKGRAFGSFGFDSYEQMAPAMSEISRRDLVSECFGFDPYLQQQRMRRESLAKDAGQFIGMLKKSGSISKALKDGAKVAMAGRRFMDDVEWSFHVIASERTDEMAAACLAEAAEIVASFGGRELPDTIPKMLDAHPFGPVNSMLGPEGERWVPVHGLVAHSQAVSTINEIEALFASHKAEMTEHNVHAGYLVATVSSHCYLIEPVFFWPDEIFEMHRQYVESEHLARLKEYAANPAARALVVELKKALIDLLSDAGAVHLQVAKAYRYSNGLKPASQALIASIKRELDPNNIMNPGALGL